MKIMKFGGSCLKNLNDIITVADIICEEKEERVVVLSAINGVTDKLISFIGKKYKEEDVKKLISELKHIHLQIVKGAVYHKEFYKMAKEKIEEKLKVLERLLYGVHYSGELPDKTRDLILSYGERLSVSVMESILNSRGFAAKAFEGDKIGIITDGNFGNAIADLSVAERNLKKRILPFIERGFIPVITGFFGCDDEGHTTIFGRNGSDYSASVIAYALDADVVEIWKDVDGFMSADPKFVKDAYLLDSLSYDEAAELAYFGARILHPRTVEPLKLKKIPLKIRNIYRRNRGTLIHSMSKISKDNGVKSVAYKEEIGALKIYGVGVGSMLGEISRYLSEENINIKSVITSQTSITLLLEKEDVEKSYRILKSKRIRTLERLEKILGISLIGIVGNGILEYPDIAAKVFNALAKRGVNVEMFAAGASEVALYLIVKQKYLRDAVESIHKVFLRGGEDNAKT